MFKDLQSTSLLGDLHQVMHTRTQGTVELLDYEDGGSNILNTQRDGFRKQIGQAGLSGHVDDNLSSFNTVFVSSI